MAPAKSKLEELENGTNQSRRGYDHDRVYHLLYRSQNNLKLERISMNQSSMDLNQDNVLLVEFSPSPCIELKRISMKLFPSQVKKNFF